MMATLNPGDEVIMSTPFWVSYADIVLIAGGRPILVPCTEDNGFRLTAETLEGAITYAAHALDHPELAFESNRRGLFGG